MDLIDIIEVQIETVEYLTHTVKELSMRWPNPADHSMAIEVRSKGAPFNESFGFLTRAVNKRAASPGKDRRLVDSQVDGRRVAFRFCARQHQRGADTSPILPTDPLLLRSINGGRRQLSALRASGLPG